MARRGRLGLEARGLRVLVKPNLVEFVRRRRSPTPKPRYWRRLVELFEKLGAAEIIIGEVPATGAMRSFWRKKQGTASGSTFRRPLCSI